MLVHQRVCTMFCRFPAFLIHFGVENPFWCTRWPQQEPRNADSSFPLWNDVAIPWPFSKSSNLVFFNCLLFLHVTCLYICISNAHTHICTYLYIKRTHSHMHIWYIYIYYTYLHIHLLVHHHMRQNLWLNASFGPDFWAYLSSAADVYHMVLIILITCIMTTCYMVSLQLNTSFSPRRSQNTVTACCAGSYTYIIHMCCKIVPPYCL